MWFLHLFSQNVGNHTINLILSIGFILCFLSIFVISRLTNWIPIVKNYITVIQIFSIAVLCIGAYLKGSFQTEKDWELKIAQTQQQIITLERNAVEINDKLAKKTAEKNKVIVSKGNTIYRYIDKTVVKDKEIIKYVESCPIPAKIIEIHNAAATNTPIEETP